MLIPFITYVDLKNEEMRPSWPKTSAWVWSGEEKYDKTRQVELNLFCKIEKK